MNRILNSILVLLTVLFSCKHNNEQHKPIVINERQSKVDTITVITDAKNDIEEVNQGLFVVFSIKDTLFVPDTGKVSNVNKIGDNGYYYTLFESYQEETDFGKNTLIIRNRQNEVQWTLELEDYTHLVSNSKTILIAFFEKDLLKYYDIMDGSLIKCIELNFNLSDINEILITEECTYIKLINEEDATTKDVLVIDNIKFGQELLKFKVNGYFSLRKENDKVFLKSGNEIKYLN